MKLGALNAAIRGADQVKVRFSFGHVAVQKTSLCEALKGSYTGKAAETGLRVTEDGFPDVRGSTMSEFVLYTSGRVERAPMILSTAMRWSDLDPFTQGYVEAMFAENAKTLVEQYAAIGQSEPWGHPNCANLAFSDIAPETLAAILRDCTQFEACGFAGRGTIEGGRTFWARRKDWWHDFPPLTPYLGDDGRVCLREA